MADKLNDQEIVKELKRFGEIVKVPIDKKKRPILIKKLNHYYAKENPPPKRGKSGGRTAKKPAPGAEFSDDSQDESESAPLNYRVTRDKNTTRNNSLTRSPINRRSKNKSVDSGASSSANESLTRPRSRNVKNKRLSNVQQMEIYPSEFSDTDDTDESQYVEEKSIGINTTLNYEEEDTEDEVVQLQYRNSIRYIDSPRNRTKLSYADANISSIGQPRISANNSAKAHLTSYTKESSGQFISKTILVIGAIFFFILAVCYLYVRRDLIFTHEAALTKPGE